MISVFGSFVRGDDPVIKMFGVDLDAARAHPGESEREPELTMV